MLTIFRLFFFAFLVTSSLVNTEQLDCSNAACYVGWNIKRHVNSSMSPCEDFYNHVCSKYSRNEGGDFIRDAGRIYYEQKRMLLNEPIRPDDEETAIKVKRQYQSCMDTETRNANGLKSLKSVIDSLGGWPLLMSSGEQLAYTKTWQEVHGEYIEKTGNESSLFNVKVNFHPRSTNRENKLIYLDTPTGPFGIVTPTTWDDTKKGAYLIYMTNLIKSFGLGGIESAQVYYGLEDVFHFRRQISELMNEPRGNFIKTINTWQAVYDDQTYKYSSAFAHIDWLSVVRASFKNIENIDIEGSTEISVLGRYYLYKFAELLAKTSPLVVVNHLHLYFMERNLKYTDETTILGLQNLYKQLGSYDLDLLLPKERACYDLIKMPHAVDRLFVRKRVPTGFLPSVTRIFHNIKNELKREIRNSRRVEQSGKAALIQKVDNIDGELGFPSWYQDESRIAGFYRDVQIGNDFIENMLQIERFMYVQEVGPLSPNYKPVPKPLLSVTNAFYTPATNSIQLSLSILRPPYFHTFWPDILKYAMAGFTIGHEISHGFDYRGYRLDEFGGTASWLTPSNNETFQAQASCYADQYYAAAKQTYPPTTINPYDFLPENIADAQGLRLVYGAFKGRGQPTETIHYLENYTEDQIFFLAFAMSQCTSVSPEYVQQLLSNPRDFHAFPSFRVNGPVSNMPEFSRAFQCRPGEKMNPVRKCNIWA